MIHTSHILRKYLSELINNKITDEIFTNIYMEFFFIPFDQFKKMHVNMTAIPMQPKNLFKLINTKSY